jgi:hypothetical protein
VLLLTVALVSLACSSDGDDTSDGAAATSTAAAPATTDDAPEVVVLEDLVGLGLDGIYAADGTARLTYTDAERECIAQGVVGIPGLDQLAGPGATTDDADLEQAVAEVALGCLGFDRVAPLATQQLAADDDLADIEPDCLAREVSSLQDTPDILAAVLRGEPDTISVIAGTVSINCP